MLKASSSSQHRRHDRTLKAGALMQLRMVQPKLDLAFRNALSVAMKR